MARVPPITGKSDVPAEHHAVVDHVLRVFGNVRGPSSVMLHSPGLTTQVLNLGDFFRQDSIVTPALRSIAILIAARERQGDYVWSAQVNAARRGGLREGAIDLIRARAAPAKYPVEEGEVVDYMEQLMRSNRVSAAAFDTLKQRHGTQWLVELTMAANYYGMLCGLVNAFEVSSPADGDKLPA